MHECLSTALILLPITSADLIQRKEESEFLDARVSNTNNEKLTAIALLWQHFTKPLQLGKGQGKHSY